jgi:DNA-binding LacI/PurR family transcriptional regulator
MKPIRLLSVVEQTTEHLRKGLGEGHWSGRLPGVVRLAAECDVSTGVVRAALRQLAAEGLLASRGPGRSRSIVPPDQGGVPLRSLRVGILLYDARPDTSPEVHQIQHDLEAAGHGVFFSKKSQCQLKHRVANITLLVKETPADAWIVVAGSHDLLAWFVAQPVPCLALYGRSDGLPLARTGPDKVPALLDATRQLIALGHRRIVFIGRSDRRKPIPGTAERTFLAELTAHKITPGPYNLPDWDETPKGFAELLDNLFRVTPPTALIIDETPRLIAAMQFLARCHIDVPGQVSLISPDFDLALSWCSPPIAQIKWDPALIVRRVVRWVAAVRQGTADRETINYPAEFIPGGSIGPAPQGRG